MEGSNPSSSDPDERLLVGSADGLNPSGRAVTVVCDGWTEPRHARIILKQSTSELVSHGMCAECDEEMSK